MHISAGKPVDVSLQEVVQDYGPILCELIVLGGLAKRVVEVSVVSKADVLSDVARFSL